MLRGISFGGSAGPVRKAADRRSGFRPREPSPGRPAVGIANGRQVRSPRPLAGGARLRYWHRAVRQQEIPWRAIPSSR